jgi:predicted MFS family arabinose efflux permease
MRRLIAINVLDAFIQGVYAWIIPVMLIERDINLTTIGIVFSAYPIVFLTSRLLFASVADSIGLKRIFQMNALGSLTSVLLYATSLSPLSYATAKASQSIKDSSLWAVNRNATYEIASNGNPQMAAATVLFIRALAIAVGAIVSSLLVFWIGFQGVFVLLAVLATSMFVPASMLDINPQRSKLTLTGILKKLDPRSMPQRLWQISFVMSLSTIASTLITSYILPIFLRSKGFAYWEIGVTSAMYTGIGALLIPITLRGIGSVKHTILIQSLLYLPAAIFIPISQSSATISLIMMMALGEATSYIIWESLVRDAAQGCDNMATAIALAHFPSNLIQIPVFVSTGFLTENYSYAAPFWVAACSFLLYSAGAWHFLKPQQKEE